jgi:predicted dehydrogenase
MSLPEMSSSPRFRVAVLSVAKHAYVPLGVAAHPRFELVVVADDADQPNWVHERNERFAGEHNIPYVRGVEKALAECNVQVVVICSQVERHCDLAVRAAKAGLHVVCDKPMSNRLSECDRAVEAVERNRVRFLLWNRNGLPAVQQAKAAVARGAIGQLYAAHMDFYFAKDAGPPKGSRKPGEPPLNWLDEQIAAHAEGADGGLGVEPIGELKIEGIYPLAYMRLLTRAEVHRVYCRAGSHFHQVHADNHVEDLASVTLEMDRGLVGTLAIGRIGAASHPDIGEIKLHLLGTTGALVIAEARPEIAVYYRGQSEKEFRHRRVGIDNDYVLMEDFAQAIDEGRPTLLDACASRAIMSTVEAALESARTGRVVDVERRFQFAGSGPVRIRSVMASPG